MSSFLSISSILDRISPGEGDRDVICMGLNDFHNELLKTIANYTVQNANNTTNNTSHNAFNINNTVTNPLLIRTPSTSAPLPNYSIFPFEISSETRIYNILLFQLFETNINEIHELVLKIIPAMLICSHGSSIVNLVQICMKNLNSEASNSQAIQLALQNNFDDYERENAELTVAKRGKAIQILQVLITSLPKQNLEAVDAVLKTVLPQLVTAIQNEFSINTSGKSSNSSSSTAGNKKVQESKKSTNTNISVQKADLSSEQLILDYMNILYSCIVNHTASIVNYHTQLLKLFLLLLTSTSKLIVKQAIASLGVLTRQLNSDLFQTFLKNAMELFNNNQAAVFQLISALAINNHYRLNQQQLNEIINICLDFSNNKKNHIESKNELREACLLALDSIIRHCGIRTLTEYDRILTTLKESLHYDPNFVGDDEQDETMEDDENKGNNSDGDEDNGMNEQDEEQIDDEDYAADDDEDSSWKVRRSASKCITAILFTISHVLGSGSITNIATSSNLTEKNSDLSSPHATIIIIQPNYTRHLSLIHSLVTALIPILTAKLLERTDHIRIEILTSFTELLSFPHQFPPNIQSNSIKKLLTNLSELPIKLSGSSLQVKESAFLFLTAVFRAANRNTFNNDVNTFMQQILKLLNAKQMNNKNNVKQLIANIYTTIRAFIHKTTKSSWNNYFEAILNSISNNNSLESMLLAQELINIVYYQRISSGNSNNSSDQLSLNRVELLTQVETDSTVMDSKTDAKSTGSVQKILPKFIDTVYKNCFTVVKSNEAKFDRIAKDTALDTLGLLISRVSSINWGNINAEELVSLLAKSLENHTIRTATMHAVARILHSVPLGRVNTVFNDLAKIAQLSIDFLKQSDRFLQQYSVASLNNLALRIIRQSKTSNNNLIAVGSNFSAVTNVFMNLFTQLTPQMVENEAILILLTHSLILVCSQTNSSFNLLSSSLFESLLHSSQPVASNVLCAFSMYNPNSISEVMNRIESTFKSSKSLRQQQVLARSAALIVTKNKRIEPAFDAQDFNCFKGNYSETANNQFNISTAEANNKLSSLFAALIGCECASFDDTIPIPKLEHLLHDSDNIISNAALAGLAAWTQISPDNIKRPLLTVAELFRRIHYKSERFSIPTAFTDTKTQTASYLTSTVITELLRLAVHSLNYDESKSDDGNKSDLHNGAECFANAFAVFPTVTASFIQAIVANSAAITQIALLNGLQSYITVNSHNYFTKINPIDPEEMKSFSHLVHFQALQSFVSNLAISANNNSFLGHEVLTVQTAALDLLRSITTNCPALLSHHLSQILTKLSAITQKQDKYIQSVKYGPVTKQIDTAIPTRLQVYSLMVLIVSHINEILIYPETQSTNFQSEIAAQLLESLCVGLTDDYEIQLVCHSLLVNLVSTFELNNKQFEIILNVLISNLNQSSPLESVREELLRYEEVISSSVKTSRTIEQYLISSNQLHILAINESVMQQFIKAIQTQLGKLNQQSSSNNNATISQ